MQPASLTESESVCRSIPASASRIALILVGAFCSISPPLGGTGSEVCMAADSETVGVGGQATTLTEIRRRAGDVLRRQAVASTETEQSSAVTELCDMFACVRCDPRYATSGILQQDAVKLRLRLLTIAKEKSIQLRRAGFERPTDLDGQIDALLQRTLTNATVQAQAIAAESGSVTKSSGHVGDKLGAAAAGALDNGWQLVGLIQRVVRPDFWEPVGGNGTIQYFAMRRVLVVRATTDVHEDVRELLRALR